MLYNLADQQERSMPRSTLKKLPMSRSTLNSTVHTTLDDFRVRKGQVMTSGNMMTSGHLCQDVLLTFARTSVRAQMCSMRAHRKCIF